MHIGTRYNRYFTISILALSLVLLIAACGTPPPAKNAMVVKTSTLPTEPEAINKPVNVNFSTYSKEWPVNWVFIDPDERNNPTPRDVKSGVLRMTIPSKKDLYGDNRNAPRYLKAIKGDFQIETRVRFVPKENYQGAGILVFKDDNNYIRFERAYGGVGGGGEGIRLDVRNENQYTPIVGPGEIQTEAPEVDLKIVRSGRLFLAYWRLDENNEWREAGEYESNYPETVLVGVLGVNTARQITAEFEYIRLLPGLGP